MAFVFGVRIRVMGIFHAIDWRLNSAVLFLIAASFLGLTSFAQDVLYKQVLALALGVLVRGLLRILRAYSPLVSMWP